MEVNEAYSLFQAVTAVFNSWSLSLSNIYLVVVGEGFRYRVLISPISGQYEEQHLHLRALVYYAFGVRSISYTV